MTLTRQRNASIKPLKPLILVLCIIVLFSGAMLEAAKPKRITNTGPALRLKWFDQHEAMKESSWFKNLPWQFIGPTNVSGRMTDVEVVAPKGKNYTIYVAGASGGVWKTDNEGTTWKPIFENAASTAIGDITLAPSNQDIIWIGTGEANIFRSSQAGTGVYKSTDAGKTWKHMGLTDTNTIARIIIHPANPDIVYVAASGHEWTKNKERGVYQTTDGGKSWKKVLFIDDETGAIDLVMDPSNPDTLYASTWQRTRKKWNDPRNEPHYSGSGIHKTTDGGKTWTPINKGLPQPEFRGRIGIDLCKNKPNVIYAFVDNYEIQGQWEGDESDSYGRPKGNMIKGATVYRSDDGGLNWKQTSKPNDRYMLQLCATYGWVFGQIRVDPVNENKIYLMGLGLNVSEDSGKTFRPLRGMHSDHHGLWIDPDNPDYLVNVNDGGIVISYDGGKNFRTFSNNLPLVQFFNLNVDMDSPFRVYGSVQDHGSYRGTVDLGKGRLNIPAVEFQMAPGGEGSSHAIDPTNPDTVYSAGFYGTITRTDMKTGKHKNIVPKPKKGQPPYRGQWIAPFIISPHNPRIIYHGMNYLFRSMDRGDSWERISPDLTYNRKDMSGDIPFQTLFTISESPLKFGLIYVGTDDGRAHVTRDSGSTWTEITRGLPYRKWVSRMVASAYDEGTVYMTQNGKRDDDFSAYVWKSVNYGKTWQSIAANIPCGPVNVIREDPKNKNILYVGTDLGVYVTIDGGKKWHVMANNLPTTYVHDLVIHPRENIMLIATHGRGLWAMDVSYLQQLTNGILSKETHLFDTPKAKLPRHGWWGGYYGGQTANIHFYLKSPRDVKLNIKDQNGQTVNELKARCEAGLNILEWDLSRRKDKSSKKNPYVKPGKYTLELAAGTDSQKSVLEVVGSRR
jgi:photosystem II stability/assembly factor-like uncharacterized protein